MTRFRAVRSVLCLALATMGCGEDGHGKQVLIPVRVQTVAPSSPARDLRFAAEVVPQTHVPILFRSGGRVIEIAPGSRTDSDSPASPLDISDRVTQGQLLARLDPGDYETSLRAAAAAHRGAAAALDQARSDLDTVEALFETRSATEAERKRAKEGFSVALAREQEARARLAQAQRAFDDTQLRSPVEGVVVQRMIELGLLVAPGTPAFVIADISRLKVRFGVPADVLPFLAVSDVLRFHVQGGPVEGYRGRISRIAPTANPVGRTFDVDLALDPSDEELLSGLVGHVDVPRGHDREEVLAVPLSSVISNRDSEDRFAVFTVDSSLQPARAKLRPIQLGELSGGLVSVEDGVRAGDQVIVNGQSRVRDGDAVRVVP